MIQEHSDFRKVEKMNYGDEERKKLRDILEQLLMDKLLVEAECIFFEKFFTEKMEIQNSMRLEVRQIHEERINNENEPVYSSNNETSEVEENDEITEDFGNLSLSSAVKSEDIVTKSETESSCSHAEIDETESNATFRKYDNKPLIDYGCFVTNENKFLKLYREPLPFNNDLKSEKLAYPLSVQYDESLCEWYICDKKASKIIKIKMIGEESGVAIIEHESVPQPSAVCIFKEGHSIAVLCEQTQYHFLIIEYLTKEDTSVPHCSYKNPNCRMDGAFRGIAKTIDGNLMSLQSQGPAKNLAIFKKNSGSAHFPIQNASNPCFIASNESTVAISDLGSNSVFLYNVDDTNWMDISFQQLRVVTSPKLDPSVLCNQAGFAFVAGLQFDVNGNLLIGDAKGHSIKLYDSQLNFLHRVSADFPLPYMSSFWVNQQGKMLLLDIKAPSDKLIYAHLGNVSHVDDWKPPANDQNGWNRPKFSGPRRNF